MKERARLQRCLSAHNSRVKKKLIVKYNVGVDPMTKHQNAKIRKDLKLIMQDLDKLQTSVKRLYEQVSYGDGRTRQESKKMEHDYENVLTKDQKRYVARNIVKESSNFNIGKLSKEKYEMLRDYLQSLK